MIITCNKCVTICRQRHYIIFYTLEGEILLGWSSAYWNSNLTFGKILESLFIRWTANETAPKTWGYFLCFKNPKFNILFLVPEALINKGIRMMILMKKKFRNLFSLVMIATVSIRNWMRYAHWGCATRIWQRLKNPTFLSLSFESKNIGWPIWMG